ncbi:MAG: tRNA (adenosine(37)-N6)-dimethylallyltransferase MiaA [Hyphomicrobiaceae bacterium]
MSDPRAILIAGPTAGGKSALALAEAEKRNGVIVNADSMQVYRDLRILTARPSTEDEAWTQHTLYGHVDGAETYSVARWLEDVAGALDAAEASGRTPVITGGTGLYFKALLEGLSPVPDIPQDIRRKWRDAAEEGGDELHVELKTRDPAAASQIRSSDRQRLVRALEVIDATGQSLLEWQKVPGAPLLDASECHRIVVAPDREILYERCNARFTTMFETGAIDEVRSLTARNLSADAPIMGTLGVAPIAAMLSGAMTRDVAIARARQDTRRYAKRQLTWARNQMSDWEWRTQL